jgi:ATP-dependent helicase HrpA
VNEPAPRLERETVMTADFGRLRARLRRLERERAPADDPRRLALAAAIAQSQARRAARAASVPAVTVDAALSIAAHAEPLRELIRDHRVVIVEGETGSGKTTQLPKLCLAVGRGAGGLIGCTQPRRIAARSVARRVAAELGVELGGVVGFQVRFTEQVSERTRIKFMTDGILLAETQGDPWLSAYDTIIVDEAHERSLNIDFLLGYLKRLLARRPDLKVLVTSATIDTARFAAHFGGAPVLSVPGRAYPVEVRWRSAGTGSEHVSRAGVGRAEPRRSETFADPVAEIVGTIDAITRENPLGDVLVFLSGEREIRDLHLALARRRYPATEVLPLYARLSARDQDRVFQPGPGRRLVLATNVAETSLTVPRIRYVVDPGLARVNRFSHRHKVQRLRVEKISQASADQRKGRCGRVGPGVCYRLYDEADYQARPRYTDPELKRSSLAGVILKLASLGLGPIEEFPFLDAPEPRAISDGYQQLVELGALDGGRTLTAIGRTLARLPIDVKLGRMLIEAHRLGALAELLVIAAFLSIQDPRERPAEARNAADRAHAEHADAKSDFVGVLKLWDAYRRAHEELPQSKLRAWCEQRFLSFLRMREWRELHRQLLLLTQDLGWRSNAEAASYEAVHRALLSGLPGQVGHKDEKGEYEGARGRRYRVFPGSALARHPPAWLLSATLLDTQRLYGLTNARVEPEWIEQQAQHLVRRRVFDPHWSRAQGRVLGYEQVSLFGLVLVARRRVAYAGQDAAEARRVFVREALLSGDIDCRARFVRRNHALLEQARAEEAKRRRHGLVKDADALAGWLEQRLPADLATAAGLDAWYRSLDEERRRALEWSLADVLDGAATSAVEFPASLAIPGHALPIEYRFEPGHAADGATLLVPLPLLNALPATRLEWLVPGLLADKVAEMIRALPKALRRNFVPAPDFARAFVEAAAAGGAARGEPLLCALAAWLEQRTGVAVPDQAWHDVELPAHLRFNLRLLGDDGRVIAEGRDLAQLQRDHGADARAAFARQAATDLARSGLTRFEPDALPARVVTEAGLQAFPALVDDGDSVAIRVYEREDAAAAAHAAGVLRLLRLALADKRRQARKQLPLAPKAAIAYTAIDSPERLREDVVEAALDGLAGARAGAVRARAVFEALAAELGRSLYASAVARLGLVEPILIGYAELAPKLEPPLLGFARASFDDLREQLAGLVYAGFARTLPLARLREIPRYLKAMAVRAERLAHDPRRDQARMMQVHEFLAAWRALAGEWSLRDRGVVPDPALDQLRWLIEELRVQLFAQELGTAEPVSEKRLRRIVEGLRAAPATAAPAGSARSRKA